MAVIEKERIGVTSKANGQECLGRVLGENSKALTPGRKASTIGLGEKAPPPSLRNVTEGAGGTNVTLLQEGQESTIGSSEMAPPPGLRNIVSGSAEGTDTSKGHMANLLRIGQDPKPPPTSGFNSA